MLWDGKLPERRYAVFTNVFIDEYLVVISGDDLKIAENWGGFVRWYGGIRPAESRNVDDFNRT